VCVCLRENTRVQMVNLYTVHVCACVSVCVRVCVYTCVNQFASLPSRLDGLNLTCTCASGGSNLTLRLLRIAKYWKSETPSVKTSQITYKDLSDLQS